MFRVEAFVDDKRLAQLLHAMTGVILGEPKIQPVANGAVKAGKAVAANSGDICELFTAFAKKRKLTEFKPAEMKEFCKSIGRAESSYGYAVRQLFECKVIRKRGKGAAMTYVLVVK